MTSLETLLKEGTKVLEQHKIQEARLDAWLLLEYVTGMNRAFYFAHSADGMDEEKADRYRELIRKNIDYENYPPIYNKQEVDELIELIVETLMLPPDAGTIRIGGKERPVPIVKSMFLKLDKDHICYILKCLHNTEKKKE